MVKAEFELSEDFLSAKDFLCEYLKQDKLFLFLKNNYPLKIEADNKFIKFYVGSSSKDTIVFADPKKPAIGESEKVVHFINITKNYSAAIKIEGNKYTYCDLDNKKEKRVDSNEYSILKEFQKYAPRMHILIDLIREEDEIGHVLKNESFYNHITKDNIEDYISLIKKNKNNIIEAVSYIKEAKKLGFDIFNLKEEDKEVIQLQTDIKFDLKLNNSFFDRLKRKFK